MKLKKEISKRRTFAIISHPDAGKTTITEKLLLYGGAIQTAGAVKSKKAERAARSDFMEMEQKRGISVSTAVMSFEYAEKAMNLLDTPGHNDFSEDTYRTLTAVDSVLMVIDSTKGVETQTKKLLDVCKLKKTPVITLMNKLDLEGMEPLDLIDNLEKELGVECVPMNWPIGKGKEFKGVYDLQSGEVHFYLSNRQDKMNDVQYIDLDSEDAVRLVGESEIGKLREEIEMVHELTPEMDIERFERGEITPVFFGSALNNFGVQTVLDAFVRIAPSPGPREALSRVVMPDEEQFTGFVFKIQANMDKNHRDRMAFIRICSGVFNRGMTLRHVRTGKDSFVRNAITFLARTRNLVETAYPGDIIGIPNHGTIRIGDTFSEGEDVQITGVPNFAPELFRRARLRDPMKGKALAKGLSQVCEEGAAQLFRPLSGSDYIIGALGELQFQVITSRLMVEYRVDADFESIPRNVCRWVIADDATKQQLIKLYERDLFYDNNQNLCILSDNTFRCNQIADKYPDVRLSKIMEQQ
ncbi:MAG: peptide chain release factor 3 [Deltaproteobacteria bacterium]|nr:peptide chain release factor 3 [Deltaproteobacteria bacterium]MBN2674387.1 peptide chain release factor 3 [Deltaproteobacteria bacterium]